MSVEPQFKDKLKGHCWCGRNTFEIIPKPVPEDPFGPPPQVYYCHCQDCRRAMSSVVVIWMRLPKSWITFSQNPRPSDDPATEKDAIFKPYSSKPGVERRFCGFCGTQLTWAKLPSESEDKKEPPSDHIDVSLGALSDEDAQRLIKAFGDNGMDPEVDHHFWYNSGLKWWQAEVKGSKMGSGVKHPTGEFHETVEE